MITEKKGNGSNTGQVALKERHRLQKLVDEGKACWWRRYRTLGEIEEMPL